MSAQTFNAILGSVVRTNGYFCKDAAGNPAIVDSVTMQLLAGDPTGLTYDFNNKLFHAVKVGTYTVMLKATNASGSIQTNAAGDTDVSEADTIVVNEPAPASQGWTYGS